VIQNHSEKEVFSVLHNEKNHLYFIGFKIIKLAVQFTLKILVRWNEDRGGEVRDSRVRLASKRGLKIGGNFFEQTYYNLKISILRSFHIDFPPTLVN
jgi:hypothetical protein